MDEVVAYTQTVAGVTKRYYPHYNHLYSVAALTGGNTGDAGQVVERYTYDAYGKQKITDASGNVTRAKSSVGWDRGFTGYIADNETGLLYARWRMYSPTLGRFGSRDPEGYIDGYTLYGAYFVPLSVDPYGLGVWAEIAKLLGKELTEEAAKTVAKDLARELVSKLKHLEPGNPEANKIIDTLKSLGWKETPLGKGSQEGIKLADGGGIKLQDPISGDMLTWTPRSAHHPADGPYWKFSTAAGGKWKSVASFLAPGLTTALENERSSPIGIGLAGVGDAADFVFVGPDAVNTASQLTDAVVHKAAESACESSIALEIQQWFNSNFGYSPF